MTPAQQALALLRNEMSSDDLSKLTDAERQQFVAILDHWLKLAAEWNKQRGEL